MAAGMRHGTNILGTAALAEHNAMNYRPRRLFAALPEVSGLGLRKSEEVRAAERRQESIERIGERKAERQGQRTVPAIPELGEWPRRRMTIEDVVGGR
jgi:hypothetical protein